MALVKCTECENEISDKAPACPKCGSPQNRIEKKKEKKTSFATWVIGGFFAITLFVAIINNENSNTRSDSPKTPEQQAQSAKRNAQLQGAAVGAAALKKAMKDPEAFELKSLVVKKSGAACYEYRAKNGFGATFPGSAILTSGGKLMTEDRNGNAFVSAWNKECTSAGGDEISELVKRTGVL